MGHRGENEPEGRDTYGAGQTYLAVRTIEGEDTMRFMVEGQLAVAPTPELFALLPKETARGKELDAQGVRLHLFVAADQSAGWQVFEVDSREELDRLLASFPLHPYVTEKVTQLADPPEA